jgi:hypothetical protein
MAFLTEAANRGSVSTGYDIENSVKLEPDNAEFLKRNQADGNRQTWTYSMWVKRTELGFGMSLFYAGVYHEATRIFFDATDKLYIDLASEATTQYRWITNRVFRDTSAWYHFVWRIDTTQSTATDRMRMYINGVLLTADDFQQTATFPQNTNTTANKSSLGGQQQMAIGNYSWANNNGIYAGYAAQCALVDGESLAPTEFGEFDEDSGIWKPKDISGLNYGTGNNSFLLEFEISSDLGANAKGNDANFTTNNITSADQATDTPTNNFCTLNPLSYDIPYTATQGNTKWSKNDTTYGMASGTHYVGAGKWYWEIKATDIGVYNSCRFGIIDAAKPTVLANEYGYEDPSLSANDPEILAMSGSPNNWYMNSNSAISNNGSTNTVDYSFYDGDILAFALDMDNGGYWMGSSVFQGRANGSFWIAPGGTATSGSVAITDPTNGNYALVGDGGGTNNGTPNFNGGSINGGSLLTAGFTLVTPLLGAYSANTSATLEVNFGGFTSYGETGGYSDENGYGNFAYAVPSGFYCLCSKNIAEFGGTA